MELFVLDDEGHLYLSADIENWEPLAAAGISAVIDLDGGLDVCVPTMPNQILYVYFPINDAELPDLVKLDAVGRLGALLVKSGHKVLSHCGFGLNRSALVAGVILRHLGMPASEVVAHLRSRRPGALYNDVFAEYLGSSVLGS